MTNLKHGLIDRLHFPLVKKFYQAYYPSGKANKADPIWVLRNTSKILVCLRLKQFDQCQLLTAMVTHPDFRQQGLGLNLLNRLILDTKQPLSNKPCYCFAFTHLVSFYQQAQFKEITPETLPAALKCRFIAYTQSGKSLTPMLYQP